MANEAAEDSASILPILTGQKKMLPKHPMVVNHDIGGSFAIRNNHWKLVLAERPLTYGLEKDRKETTDVAADHPEVVSRMKATLEQYKAQGWPHP